MWGVEVRALTRIGQLLEEMMPLKGEYHAPKVELGDTPQTVGSVDEDSRL